MVNIFNRLLQGNDVPCPCKLLLDGAFFSSTGPGFQLQTLSLFCSVNRLGMSLLK